MGEGVLCGEPNQYDLRHPPYLLNEKYSIADTDEPRFSGY